MVLVLDGHDNLDITSAEQLGKLAGGLAARTVPIGLAVAWAQSAADAPLGRPAGPG